MKRYIVALMALMPVVSHLNATDTVVLNGDYYAVADEQVKAKKNNREEKCCHAIAKGIAAGIGASLGICSMLYASDEVSKKSKNGALAAVILGAFGMGITLPCLDRYKELVETMLESDTMTLFETTILGYMASLPLAFTGCFLNGLYNMSSNTAVKA